MPKGITYVLGKDCKLFIDEEEIPGVADVAIRESTTEVDATSYGAVWPATAWVSRGYEIMISMPDIEAAKKLNKKRDFWWERKSVVTGPSGPVERVFRLPEIHSVRLEGGLEDIAEMFTIHQIDADQSLDGVVVPRFSLRQWGGTFDEMDIFFGEWKKVN